MRRITFILLLIYSCGYAQLAPECFEGNWAPVAAGSGTAAQWLKTDNGIGTTFSWVQQPHTGPLPSYEGTVGTNAAYIQRENVATGIPAADYLVTPEFNMPVGGQLRFWSKLTIVNDNGSIYKIMVLPAGGDPTNLADYELVEDWTEAEIAISPLLVYEEKIITFAPEYANTNVRIAFVMEGDFGDRWQIDCVSVTQPCGEVENLTAGNIDPDSAELTWDNPGGATSWEIEIVPEGDLSTGKGIIYSGALPYVATATASGDPLLQVPFLSYTGYRYYVKAICDDGGTSDIVGPYFFRIVGPGDSCAIPLDITALPFSDTDNTATFVDEYNGMPGSGCGNPTWEDYLAGNDVVYSFTADFTGDVSVELTNNDSYSGLFIYDECSDIGGACIGGGVGDWLGNDVIIPEFNVVDGEDYFFVISSYVNQTTNYTLTIQQVSCDKPVGLAPTNIGMTSADLNWTNPTGATSWEIYVQDPGDGIPAGAGTTVTSNSNVTVTEEFDGLDLISATLYEYFVRASCGDGTFSAWAGPYYFNPLICEMANQCTYTFNMWDQWNGTWNGFTMDVIQNGIVVATLTGPTPGAGIVSQQVQLCDGYPFELYWNANGGWPTEIGVSVENSFGQLIYTKNPGAGSPGTTLYSLALPDCDAPMCLPSTGLEANNIGMTTVDLSWDDQPTGNWEYYITDAGNPAPTPADAGIGTTTNPTAGATLIEGGTETLVMSTNYEYYVRMVCEDVNGDENEWSAAFPFATASCEVVDRCEYTFIMNSNGWPGGWQGGFMTILQNGATVAVIGPSFTTGGIQSVTVPLCDDIPFEVYWDNGGSYPGQIGLQIINSYDQVLYTMPFYSTGVGTVIFEADNDCDFPTCVAPTGLYTQNGTMTSIELVWDGLATGNWEYFIIEAGSPAPDDATGGISATTNPVTAPLPEPGTNYEYYLRAVCEGAANDYSKWAGPHVFHSEICAEEDKCNFIFEMLSQNNFGGGGNTFTIYQAGVPVATFPSAGNENWWGNGYSEEIALCHNGEIEVVWNALGSYANDKSIVIYSPFEDIYTMDFGSQSQGDAIYQGLVSCDPPSCPKPNNLSVTDTGLTQVTLNWEEMGDAAEWAVWVVPMGSEDPLPTDTPTFTTIQNTVIYGDDASEVLEPGTPYQFYVMAMCGEEDGNSTVAGESVFLTAIGNDNCEGATDVPVNPGIECIDFITGTITGATYSGIVGNCWGDPWMSDIWYSFEATSVKHAVSISNFVGAVDSLPYIAVFEGDCDGGLSEVYCGFTQTVTLDELTVGNTYYVQVVSWVNDPSAFTSFELCIKTGQPPITVSDSLYTTEELVQEVLLGSECAVISNVTSSTGSDFGSSSGIGYFNRNGSNFPFEDGMILATGDIQEAPAGSTLYQTNDVEWVGADDGEFLFGTYNASIVEFDFVPASDNMSFNFLFASHEYGTWQCIYSDVFAFILTGPGMNENLAVIPNTNIPVSVTTIRDSQYNTGCISQNVEYFGQYNDNDLFASNINFRGQTVVMQAAADVIPGQTYHIKLVIADWLDTSHTSAVFIEGGSFDVGEIDLGLDMTQENDNAICDGGQTVLDTQLDEGTYDFIWYADGVVIDGETGKTLLINQNNYDFGDGAIAFMVEAFFVGSDCAIKGDVIIEFYPNIEEITNAPQNLNICDDSGFAEFNLVENTPVILDNPAITNPGDYVVTYYTSEEEAIEGEGALPDLYTNTIMSSQTIWVRIENTVTGCHILKGNFTINVNSYDAQINEGFGICEGTTATITVEVESGGGTYSYAWTKDGEPFVAATADIEVDEQGTYEVIVTDANGCIKTASVTVTLIQLPIADEPGDVFACAEYMLPALTVGTYHTGAGGTGETLAEGALVTETQTIYVWASTNTIPACTDENSFTVTITDSPVITTPGDQIVCGSYSLPELNLGNYYTGTGGTGTMLAVGDVVDVTQNIYVYAATGTCFDEEMFIVTILEIPEAVEIDDVTECISYALPALADGNDYFTASNGTGVMLIEGDIITTTQTIYIYAQSATEPNCVDETDFTVTIVSTPEFSLGGPYVACNVEDLAVSVNAVNFDETTASYVWTINGVLSTATGSSIQATEFGTYEVTVTVNGCEATQSIQVTESTAEIAAAITDECIDDVYTLTAFDVDGSFEPSTTAYRWTGPNGFAASTQAITPEEPGTYNVTITTAENCTGIAAFEVGGTQCFIQRGISPNNDGDNDFFDLSELDVDKLSIFNRYGQEVYNKSNYTVEWIGQTNNGDELPTGTYFYMIQRSNGEQITGWIYINREVN